MGWVVGANSSHGGGLGKVLGTDIGGFGGPSERDPLRGAAMGKGEGVGSWDGGGTDLRRQLTMVKMGEGWRKGGSVIGSGKGQRGDFLENRKALLLSRAFHYFPRAADPHVLSCRRNRPLVVRTACGGSKEDPHGSAEAPAGGGFSRGEPGGVPHDERATLNHGPADNRMALPTIR